MTTTTFVVRPEAMAAWHALGGTLTRIADEGRLLPCQINPDPFTSDDSRVRREVAPACEPCPARTACQGFAQANRETENVWAGIDHGPRNLHRKETTK